MKNIIVLSTLPPLMGTTKDDDKQKPAIIKLYDFTKIGTDVVDQKGARNSTKTTSPRWLKAACSYILDIIRNNAMVLWALNSGKDPRKVNSFEFTIDLAESLTQPHLQRRSFDGLQSPTLRKMEDVGVKRPIPFIDATPDWKPKEGSKRRCQECNDALKATASKMSGRPKEVDSPSKNTRRRLAMKKNEELTKKAKKDKLPKGKMQCQKCKKSICRKHFIQLCNNCAKFM